MNPPAPLRVIIVEDQTSIRLDLEEFLQQQPGFTIIGACATVHDALVLIHATKPDLLLLDIGLPDGTGFDILEQMRPVQSKVIFITAYQEYAIRAFRCGAIDYLLKPLNFDEFRDALRKVSHTQPLLEEQITITLQSFRKQKLQDHLALRSQQFVEIVEVQDICYLEGDNGCTTVFLNGGKKVVTTKYLKDYEELLPAASFLRTHHSYLVNENYIHRYHPKDSLLVLKDGTQIPVSARKKEKVDKYFKKL
jgi:two-component system LytT family response regulator